MTMILFQMIIVIFLVMLIFVEGLRTVPTLGANLVYSEDIQNLGLLWTQALGKYALLDTMASSSHSDLGDGYTVGAAISHSWKAFSLWI